jgi:DNA repair exonuclease SbcCD ATPase subunit
MTLEQQVHQNDVKLHKLIREVETLKQKLAQMEAKNLSSNPVRESVCPECGEPLIEKWSGVKCSKCDYWECY